jgi:NAD(P)-dependent dehydrogenase (short-subunit alcohol dehydrogenase family)
MSNIQPVAVVGGLGPGLGAALCRRLAEAGYAVAGLARSTEFGTRLGEEIGGAGGRFLFAQCDLADPASLDRAFSAVERELGPVSVYIHHAGDFHTGPVTEIPPETFERVWRVTCFGALLASQRVLPGMLAKGEGTLLFTGATASVKAAARFAAFGAAKFGLRGLAQSMARELGPQGIHVGHVVIDGVIWSERVGERWGLQEGQCLKAEAIAETYMHLIRQDPSAWTFELEVRPHVESF